MRVPAGTPQPRMGSLPNLHELSREKLSSPVHRPAPVGGLGPVRLPPQPPPLAHTHKRARSSGHHHHATQLWDNDAMLEVSAPPPGRVKSFCGGAAPEFARQPYEGCESEGCGDQHVARRRIPGGSDGQIGSGSGLAGVELAGGWMGCG